MKRRGAATERRVGSRARPLRATRRSLRASDLMTRGAITVKGDMTVGSLCDLLQERNINGVPVVDKEGYLVGVVTQEDIIYGAMGHPGQRAAPSSAGAGTRRDWQLLAMLRERRISEVPRAVPRTGEKPFWSDLQRMPDPVQIPVSAIMTSPAIAADEDTPVTDLCRIMWNLRIHRVPILKNGKVTGLVSAMDLCRAILSGRIKA